MPDRTKTEVATTFRCIASADLIKNKPEKESLKIIILPATSSTLFRNMPVVKKETELYIKETFKCTYNYIN